LNYKGQSFIDIWPAQHDSNVRPTP